MGKVQLDLSKLGAQSTSAPAQNAPSGLDSLTLDLSLLGATVPKKKEDTGLSGLESSTAGSSSRNQGADTGNLFGKLFRGLNIATNQFYGGVYDVVGSLLNSTAATLDVIRPYNWGADAKIALDAIGSDFKSTGRKISDLLALDSEEANKQSNMDFAQKQKYLKERYTEKTTNKDYGFISSEGGAPKALYELGGFLQNVGDDVSEEAKLDSGIAKEDLNKGVIDLIGEGKYSDAAAVAALGAVRTIPMSMSLAATGGSAKSIFAGSAFMGAGAEIGEAYKDDKKISGDELMRAGWYGFIEGLTESIFRTDINALRNTGKTLISGSPITEAVAEAGADEVKRKLVRGFLPTAKKIFYGAGEEGVEEIMSTIGQFMVDKAQSDDQEVTAKELWSLAKRAGDAFIVGSISGGGMSGGLVMATSNALDDTQKKSIKRLQEVVDNQDLSQETRDIAKNKIEDIMKYQERGSYDNYTAIASIEDVEKRSQAIDALYSIEQLKSDKKIAKDETIQSDIDDKIQQKEEFVNKLMDEQALKEYDRQPEALKVKLQEAKIKADEYLAENNSYLAFQEDHASTLEDVNNNKNVEVEVLNKATDQLNEVEQDVVNSQELTPLQKDAILTKIGAQIDSLERYSNATINGAKLSETETEGRRTTTKARAFERARRVRNNRFNGEVFTAFDEAGKPMQVTAQVNERGQISLLPKPKYRVNLETKAAEQVDNSIKIKGELEVIDQEVNEDGDITRVKVKDTKTGKIFETNSPSIIPLLTANKTIREGVYEPDRAYQVDENIELIGSSPIVNKLTKEQRARIKRYHMALKEINPNSRVVIFDNATEVAKELMKRGISRKEAILKSRSSNGMIVGDDIFIDRMSMNDTTIPHEIFHQAFREIAKKDPKLFIQMQNRIMMVLPTEIANKLQKFADSYAEKASEATDEELVEMAEEFLVELGGMMTIGEAKLQRGFMQNVMTAIREVLEKYARKFKLNGLADLINSKLFSEAAEIEELAQFFESLSKSVRQGTKINTSYLDEQLKRSEEELPDGVSQEIDENAEDGQEINTESLRLQKKGKSLIEELGLKRYPQMNQSIRTKIALKDLGKVKAHLTFSDRLVTGKVGERDYFGGILFASATGSVWASFTRGGVSKIVSGMTMNEDGYRYLMPALLTEEAHMSNKDMLNTSLELVEQAIANKDISAEEANNRIQKVFKKKALAKYGEIYNANLNEITPESVKAALDAAIVASNSTFEDRKSFLESLLGKADINTKLRFGTLPSFGQLANGLAEPITQGLDHGDIALAIRTKGELSIHQPVEGDKDYHPSYPFVVRSTEPVETLVFDHAHNAIDVYPVIKNKQGETRSFEEYQKVYGAQAKPAYLGYMGGRSTMATSVSEMVEEGAQKKGAVPEIKAQKKSTTVYHGGTVQGAKSFNKNNIFFVATDKDEALAYARGNEGNLIQMDIDGSKIAPEIEIREILTDLGVPDEYMIHELIDPRFEDTYIGKKLTSQLINEIDKRGYEGGAFSDTGIAKSRNAQNMFIVNPAKTLSNNQYVGIQLVNESNADKLYKSGYRPLVNEKVIENATEQELEDLFSKTSNLVADNKLQMVKPLEFEKYNQAREAIKSQKKQPSFLSQTLSGHTESEENRRGASIKKAYSNLMQGKFGEAYKGVSQVRFELYRSAYKLSFDRMVNVRKEMENSEFNRSMYLMFNKAGASQFGNFKFEKAFAKIYKGLTKEQVTELDAVIFLRRVIAIDENFDNQRVAIQNKLDAIAQIIAQDPSLADSYSAEIAKLKRDLKAKARPKHSSIKWVDKNKPVNKESAEAALEKGKQELGDEAYKEPISRSDMYFKEFSNILKYKMDNGLITQETYNMFKDYNYSPRKFLDYAFGIEERDEQGNLTGRILLNANQFHFRGSLLSSDDIKNIEGGSEDFMITDSRQLLQGAMIMAEVKVATNKMVKALANDSELTNQGWVKPMEYEKYNDGTIKTNPDGSYKYLNPSKGFREMIYKVDGKKYAYQLREDLAREFLDEELKDLKGETGSLRRKFNDLGAFLSGSRWVKLFATGINAGFFVSNIPVDVISQVNVTDIYAGGIAGQYKQAFGGTIDLSKRLLNMEMGFSDPYVEGLLKEYAQSGGLMMTQTEQGLGVNFKNKLVEYLALFGNISEIASKLNSYRTVKERLMDEYYDKNKMNPTGDDMEAIREEAAYKARAAMDYHRGGLASKMWDQYVPYFNVFSQGAFISWKYIKNNPTVFFDKIAKAGIALSGLTVYNMMVAGADYDNDDVQMDLLNKIVIFMPWRNPDGTRSYWKISVPPIVKGFLNTFQHIGEGSYYKYVSQEPSRQQKWREEVMERWLDGFRPSLATYVGIPTAKAFLEYRFGVDLYRNVPLFYEGKYPVSTSKEGMNEEKVLEFSKLWGKFTGMSPIKAQKAFEDIIPAYNPLVQMGYHILDKAIDSANPLLPDGVQLKEYQRSKYGKETLTNVPLSFITGIKDRLVDKTDPTVKYMKDRERSLEIDEKRGDVYYDLKAEMKSFVKEGGDSKVLIEKIKDRPVMEQKFAINYFFMLQKRDMLNYPDQFDEYSNIMFSADPKAKAEKLYERGGTTNYLNPQNEKETKEANDLMMLKILDAPTMLEYQNYFKPTGVQASENK